jgi:beta-1,4-mannosyltransferase
MVFITVASQRDNLGDSLLRRPLIRAAQVGGACHVFVGRGGEVWTNLGLRSIDKLYTGRRLWYLALIRSALVRRTTLVLNAGELLPDRRFLLARTLMAPAIALIKLRGGALIHAGFGIRDPKARVPFIARATVRMSDVASWRDEVSRAAVGAGTVAPDWGLAEGPSTDALFARHNALETDRVVAVSLRGDGPLPSSEWLDVARRAAAFDLKARIVVVCQVRRDAARAEWLAAQLGAELVGWPDEANHADQEARVRAAYSSATWVASNRLHSVIMAVTEGAVPLDLVPDQSRKISRTLAVIDLALFPAKAALQRIDDDQTQVRAALGFARSRLADLSAAIDRAILGVKTSKTRVLHTTPAPNYTTRYNRHMAATEDVEIRPLFLNWRRALFGGFDVLHVHWPEHFVPAGSRPRDRVARVLAMMIIGHLRRRQIPVVRTLHNITPHLLCHDGSGERLRIVLNDLTRAEIHLVPGDPRVSRGEPHLIPHGSYREPYADTVTESAIPGRVLHFGRLESYKGVPELLAVMRESSVDHLRIVGAPADRRVAAAIHNAAKSDGRISYRLAFVADSELALEISRSTFCVFPYRELHSSGAVLVALSMNRPILVPRTPTTEALQQEVGSKWVRIYETFDGAELDAAMAWFSSARPGFARPDLSDRTWQLVRDRHGAVIRSLTGLPGSASKANQ